MEQLSQPDRNRIITLEGAYNVRDLGGFATEDGGTVRKGLLFRSDELSGLTEADLSRLDSLGIKTIVDFRSKAETARAKNSRLGQIRTLGLNIDCGDSRAILLAIDNGNGSQAMKNVNRSLVRDYSQIFREFFRLISEKENLPLLFHCTAGKDRTGFAAAMFLSALGVSLEDVFSDYMLSASGVKEKFSAALLAMPKLAPVIAVRADYLLAAFEEIDASFGSLKDYLTSGLGVDMDKMRDIFVE